ncbi:MAG: hypothetical protein M1838_003813 [Thelocarpon superellum]|nr:MAG: hypothetical protein M1838_003813 [Thelocarpon superellum]
MGLFTPSQSSHSHSSSRRHSSSAYYRPSSTYSSSSSRRRPRDGFIQRIIYQMRRFMRDLIAYARRNPMRVVMMVIMPLLTGGALTGVLRRFGIRMPPGLFGGGRGGSSYSGGSSGGLGALAGGGGVQGLMKIAQAFM